MLLRSNVEVVNKLDCAVELDFQKLKILNNVVASDVLLGKLFVETATQPIRAKTKNTLSGSRVADTHTTLVAKRGDKEVTVEFGFDDVQSIVLYYVNLVLPVDFSLYYKQNNSWVLLDQCKHNKAERGRTRSDHRIEEQQSSKEFKLVFHSKQVKVEDIVLFGEDGDSTVEHHKVLKNESLFVPLRVLEGKCLMNETSLSTLVSTRYNSIEVSAKQDIKGEARPVRDRDMLQCCVVCSDKDDDNFVLTLDYRLKVQNLLPFDMKYSFGYHHHTAGQNSTQLRSKRHTSVTSEDLARDVNLVRLDTPNASGVIKKGSCLSIDFLTVRGNKVFLLCISRYLYFLSSEEMRLDASDCFNWLTKRTIGVVR